MSFHKKKRTRSREEKGKRVGQAKFENDMSACLGDVRKLSQRVLGEKIPVAICFDAPCVWQENESAQAISSPVQVRCPIYIHPSTTNRSPVGEKVPVARENIYTLENPTTTQQNNSTVENDSHTPVTGHGKSTTRK